MKKPSLWRINEHFESIYHALLARPNRLEALYCYGYRNFPYMASIVCICLVTVEVAHA